LSEAKFKYQHMVYPASPVHNPICDQCL